MARWVPIRRYHVREGVLVERSVLESAGIPVMAPDMEFYANLSHIADSSLQGYCLFVLDVDVDDARAILNLRDDTQTSYPCPQTGHKTRRLKRVWAIILLTSFLGPFGGPWPAPLRRRMRICPQSGVRFLPEPPEPFTAEEVGYPVASPSDFSVAGLFSRFKRWTRSVGYDSDIAFESRAPSTDKRKDDDTP